MSTTETRPAGSLDELVGHVYLPLPARSGLPANPECFVPLAIKPLKGRRYSVRMRNPLTKKRGRRLTELEPALADVSMDLVLGKTAQMKRVDANWVAWVYR